MANNRNSYNGYNIDSKIYKWDGTSFAEFQSIPTSGALDWHSFEIAGETYLAVANHDDYPSYNIDSKVYKWDGASFAEFQSIPTSAAMACHAFKIAGVPYLALGNYYDKDFNPETDSKVYRWLGELGESTTTTTTTTTTPTTTAAPAGIVYDLETSFVPPALIRC